MNGEIMEFAIKVSNLTKKYNLYKKPQDRLKEIFSFTKKRYHDVHYALNNVSFEVHKGETIGIIGKNGAGKSTLLKLITGVTTPTSGSIEVNGQVAALLELGTGFNPEYNGFENIYLNGTMRGFSKEEMDEKISDIVAFADIGDYIHQPVKTYSSGMFARLAFAVMISFKPDILIVDEALSVGDVFFQQKCNTYMKEEMKDVTKLLVTHDMNSIANMADRVFLFDKGNLIEEGSPFEVISDYLRVMHSELFDVSKSESEKAQLTKGFKESYDENLEDNDSWDSIIEDEIGGAGEVKFLKTRVYINNMISEVVKFKDKVCIEAILRSKKNCKNLIIGYTFKDKYGNSIFAMNTIGENIKIEGVAKDKLYKIKIEFHWPEIKEGDYFLTLGIGEGYDQMVHVIQCWAHNIAHVESIANRPMHGIINHNIDNFEIREV